MNDREKVGSQVIEQLGVYDPMPNQDNQKLVSLNIERTRYWMGQGANFSPPAAKLLGVVGFLPIHPVTITEAWKNREVNALLEAKAKAAEAETAETSQPPSSAK
jgi:small subunit ribosomal protein S16